MKRLERVFAMSFASVHPLYVNKAEKKGRTKQEVNKVICWLTRYSPQALAGQIKRETSLDAFFDEAPQLHTNAHKITGTVCGVRSEEVEHPLMRKIRYTGRLKHEFTKGWPMEKTLRT